MEHPPNLSISTLPALTSTSPAVTAYESTGTHRANPTERSFPTKLFWTASLSTVASTERSRTKPGDPKSKTCKPSSPKPSTTEFHPTPTTPYESQRSRVPNVRERWQVLRARCHRQPPTTSAA
uniref:(northern house mosquito) hypothetical protein n=1 Tax=Culex pipiens TaxID=7175 RepID=A0A8D8I713_CULPI